MKLRLNELVLIEEIQYKSKRKGENLNFKDHRITFYTLDIALSNNILITVYQI